MIRLQLTKKQAILVLSIIVPATVFLSSYLGRIYIDKIDNNCIQIADMKEKLNTKTSNEDTSRLIREQEKAFKEIINLQKENTGIMVDKLEQIIQIQQKQIDKIDDKIERHIYHEYY